jgi:hypothetical protein
VAFRDKGSAPAQERPTAPAANPDISAKFQADNPTAPESRDIPVGILPDPPSVPIAGSADAPEKAKRKYKRDPLNIPPADVLASDEDVPETEWVNRPLSSGPPRDAAQVSMDVKVKELFDKWVAAGKPVLAKSPRKAYRVAPEHAPAIQKMLTSAATFHGITVKADRTNEPDGRVAIVYTARDKNVRKSAKDAAKGTVTETAIDKPADDAK